MSLPPTITVSFNGQAHALALGTTLAQLLEQQGHTPQAVSSAVNQSFVARHLRATHALADGDVVLLFQPIVGG
jgi:sulfur carrier protein